MGHGKIKILDSDDKQIPEWIHYYNLLENRGIYHCPGYIKVLEGHLGYSAELCIFEKDAGHFIYYPYFRRNLENLPFAQHCDFPISEYSDIDSSWYYGGPLSNLKPQENEEKSNTAFVNAFSGYCIESKIVSEFIRFDPNLENHLHFEKLLPISRNREIVFVDLSQSEDEIWRTMDGRARTAIRKAKKMGVKVGISSDKRDIDTFYEIYAAEMKRKKAPAHYHFAIPFFQELFENLDHRFALIYAEVDGTFFSGGIFVYEEDGPAHYYLMATSYAHRNYQSNSLILYEAMLFFKKMGLKVFDLQGGREDVHYFKKSFSKHRAPFFTASIVHNRQIYEQLVKAKDTFMGKDNSDFFPAYRVNDTN